MNLTDVIKACQRKVRVDDDGEAGPQTWGAIARALEVPMQSSVISDQLADIAESQLGVQEDAKHTNRGLAILKYQQATNLDGQGWPWCAAFVDWCLQVFFELHVELAYLGLRRPETAAAFGLIDWAKKHHLELFRGVHQAPRRNDIVVYDFSHCGIVAGADPQARTFSAVEGNTNPDGGRDGYAVARQKRGYGSVKQFIRLPFLAEAA